MLCVVLFIVFLISVEKTLLSEVMSSRKVVSLKNIFHSARSYLGCYSSRCLRNYYGIIIGVIMKNKNILKETSSHYSEDIHDNNHDKYF